MSGATANYWTYYIIQLRKIRNFMSKYDNPSVGEMNGWNKNLILKLSKEYNIYSSREVHRFDQIRK